MCVQLTHENITQQINFTAKLSQHITIGAYNQDIDECKLALLCETSIKHYTDFQEIFKSKNTSRVLATTKISYVKILLPRLIDKYGILI